MKPLLAILPLATVASASAQSAPADPVALRDVATGPRVLGATALTLRPIEPRVRAADGGPRNAQLWVGAGALSYERFSGSRASDELGFTPTGYLGYQRNFYPQGRARNGLGYAVGIGAYAVGVAAFYQQRAVTRRGVDFRAGLAPDFVYDRHASSFSDQSHFSLVPFLVWGVKL